MARVDLSRCPMQGLFEVLDRPVDCLGREVAIKDRLNMLDHPQQADQSRSRLDLAAALLDAIGHFAQSSDGRIQALPQQCIGGDAILFLMFH